MYVKRTCPQCGFDATEEVTFKERLMDEKTRIAKILWDTGVVAVNKDKPFKLTSGKTSPVYFNCRKLLAYPAAMSTIVGQWAYAVAQQGADVIVGGESAGIPFAAWLAQALGKPMAYARKGDRKHGLLGKLEGANGFGRSACVAVLIEDLITDGGSKLPFLESIRQDFHCADCFVVLDREQGGAELLRTVGVQLHSLITAKEVLMAGLATACITRPDFEAAIEALEA